MLGLDPAWPRAGEPGKGACRYQNLNYVVPRDSEHTGGDRTEFNFVPKNGKVLHLARRGDCGIVAIFLST